MIANHAAFFTEGNRCRYRTEGRFSFSVFSSYAMMIALSEQTGVCLRIVCRGVLRSAYSIPGDLSGY